MLLCETMRWGDGSCDLLRCKFFVLLVLVGCSDGYLNIFISQSQVMKLLGLEAELYYVREGVVNTYAMNFVVPVPAYIADLEFSWQSLTGHPLPYSMELDYDVVGVPGGVSGMMALLPPKVNVSARGEVPVTLQVFRIRLPCSGLVSAQIPLALRLNVTAPPGTKYNDTILVFKRNKICLKAGVRALEEPTRDSIIFEWSPNDFGFLQDLLEPDPYNHEGTVALLERRRKQILAKKKPWFHAQVLIARPVSLLMRSSL